MSKIHGIAHRGYPHKHPENTLRGFRAALELGFDHLELDVQLTSDGVPVVIHDATLDRTTNGLGLVRSYTLQELKQLDAGDGERIPTLEEALLLLKDRLTVDIELKQTGDAMPGLEQTVLDVINRLGMKDQVILSSFDHYSIERVRELDSEIAIGLISYGASASLFPYLAQLHGKYLSVKHVYVTPSFIERCREEDVRLMVWTPDDEASLRVWSEYPDLLVCTNNLEGWISVTEARQAQLS
ncbi:glycerophosphodiester phosphodiesterase [Paenibacillus lutimineralis]|uniref:Glycerophosphodiester phosphodiesterase n=1 Tax=Paenibacillus lutimineralis TaxID=2707005 RepID=A0A3S9UUD1_9BACL|nr:glycerophosphodiester phosphodiesterase family protein [Paenibacillus lutimineralis]AZS13958.1 glycerophosphodiester phosphodiesterase [Paenibacillus lutimineralis]